MKYRVNFSNGQVSETFSRYRDAKAAYFGMAQDIYFAAFWIDWKDEFGEWFPMPGNRKRPEIEGLVS